MYRLLGFIFMLCGHWTHAQHIIFGKVITDKHVPVPFAHIAIEGTPYGTIANKDGNFRLTVPNQLQEIKLTVSAIGYLSATIPIHNTQTEVTVTLRESVVELEAVVVKPIDYGRKLVMAAINNIPTNYPSNRELLTVFTRLSSYKDSTLNTPYYIIEGQFEAQKESYGTAVNKKAGNIKVIESRKFEFQGIDSLLARFYGGTHFVHWGDLVATRSGPLSEPSLYDFEIVDTLIFDQELTYKVHFDSRNKGRGEMYIQNKSYALIKMTLEYNRREVSTLGMDALETLRGYDRLYRKCEASYFKSGEKWRIKSGTYSSAFENKGQMMIFLKDQLLVTQYTPQEEEIPYKERFDLYKPLIMNIGMYDSAFWDGKNILLPDETLENLLKTNPLRDINKLNKRERIVNILSKFSLQYGGMILPQHVNQGSVDYQNEVNIQESLSEGWSSIFAFQSNISYELKPHFYLGIETWSSIKKNLITGNFLTTHYDYQLFPNVRPFYLTPGLKIGYVNSRQKFTTIHPETTFKLDGKKFDANQVDVYIENRSICLTPSLSLSIEKNSRMRFYLEGGYNFMLEKKEGLFLIEDQMFFKSKKAFIPSDDENLTMDFRSRNSIRNDFFLGFGVIFQL